MKKLTMICMSALLMLAVSCKKDKKDEIENSGNGFRATVESHESTGKTHLEGLAVKWDSGDEILVKSSTCTTPKRFTTTGTDASANFDAAESLPTNFYAPPYTGYYPADKFSGDQLTLPPTQQYDENNTFASGANPMAATSSETLLPFKNVCGVLKLQLYSATACQVQSISITSNSSEQLYGTGTVTLTDGFPTLGTLSNGGTTLTLVMGEGGKAMSTSESQPSAYYFVVPVGTLSTSFTVKVTETNGNVWTKTANAPQNLIARSQITVLPKQAVATYTPIMPSSVTLTAGCSNENIYNVGGSVTVPEGTHTCEFGLVYSDSDNTPTIEEGAQKVVAGTATFSGTKEFTADITGLTVGTTYHVRAYAMIVGTAYSTAKDFSNTPLPLPSSWTNNGGKSPHPFTVGMDGETPRKVYFSQGNLQYCATGSTAEVADGENVGGTWRFAEHQFDFVGDATNGNVYKDGVKCNNANVAQTYDGWIDLFGWGTSGYNHNNRAYQPWKKNTAPLNDYYVYNSNNKNLEGGPAPHTGKADWGNANAIINGGNTAGSWRTLTKNEWVYLINTRTDSDGNPLYGEGKVGNCTPGLIILPDDWETYKPNLPFTPGASSWSNVYSYSEWSLMEAAGAVFLPAAGYRDNSSVKNVGSKGYYYSSSFENITYVYRLLFSSDNVSPGDHVSRSYGNSVRLVSKN